MTKQKWVNRKKQHKLYLTHSHNFVCLNLCSLVGCVQEHQKILERFLQPNFIWTERESKNLEKVSIIGQMVVTNVLSSENEV